MSIRRRVTWLYPLFLIALVVGVPSCGDDGTPMGGGGGGLELNSPNLGTGGTYSHTFASAGTFNYHCKFHGGMNGSVSVDAAHANTTVAVSITDNQFNPTPAQVKPGGTVTWTNNGGSTHTVTSN